MFHSSKIFKGFLSAVFLFTIFFVVKNEEKTLKELFRFHRGNSPFKQTQNLSKKNRIEEGLPPNKFYEQLYDLTINPRTGVPDYERKINVEKELEAAKSFPDPFAVPGDTEKPWYSVGPNDDAGRSRAALWDRSIVPYQRVFAGGVSGGLWKNNNITNSLSPWSRIVGVPGNLAVSVIIQDPENTNIMYLGTGESYTAGDAYGNGIYKSTDGGNNWSLIYGRGTGTVTSTNSGFGETFVNGFFYVNDLVLWDHDKNPGTQKLLFAAIGSSYVRGDKMKSTYTDLNEFGLYKSSDSGASFSRITDLNNGGGTTRDLYNVNDLEIQAVSNRLWLSTTNNWWGGGARGGRFWFSDDGTNFTQASPNYPATPTINQGQIYRTEIAPSAIDTDTHYVLMRANAGSGNKPFIFKTTDNYTNFTYVVGPNDVDTGIDADDFTRGQAWYDLEIEIDPTSNDKVYVGGINWHKTSNGGDSWEQISKWHPTAFDYNTINCSVIHADQHGLYFRPGNPNQAIVVNDGGVAYVSSLSDADTNDRFTENERGMITTQFYTVAQSGLDFPGNDYIIGGTQDNGSYALINTVDSPIEGTYLQGGDGAESVFDQVGGDFAITNYIYNDNITRHDFDALGNRTPDFNFGNDLFIPDNEGVFINPGALDSNQNVYFSNAASNDDATSNSMRVITGLKA